MLSTLKAKLPTKSVDPSGALHPLGDFPLYGIASMGILSPKGTRTIRSSVMVMAPSLSALVCVCMCVCVCVCVGGEVRMCLCGERMYRCACVCKY